MRLGYKILVPQMLLLALLSAAGAALFVEQRRQASGLHATIQALGDATWLAQRVQRLHASIAVEVLAYQIDRKPRRIEAAMAADREADAALENFLPTAAEKRQAGLLAAVIESRKLVEASRIQFITAIDTGGEPEVQAAFDRWRIHRKVLEANLDDWFTFSLDRFAASSEQAVTASQTLVRMFALVLATAIAITGAAFLYVRRRISIPLQVLVSGIGKLGGGELGARLDLRLQDGRDDIGVVATAFNAMAGAVENQARELERRVAERTAQLEAANRELEAFAYSVSHDLRAPLRSIDGFSQALLEDYDAKLDDEGRDSLRRVRQASQRMGGLIDDMLKLSRATRGEVEMEPVDLSGLAEAAAAGLREEAPGRHASIEIAPGIVGRGDQRLLAAVLENLFSNAWKFTARKDVARIEFGARLEGTEVVCHVRDNGAGFDMAHAAHLFTPFQRLHQAKDFPGNGIGLATVKRIVQRLGGRVWAEGAVDRGATFYFTLAGVSKGEAPI